MKIGKQSFILRLGPFRFRQPLVWRGKREHRARRIRTLSRTILHDPMLGKWHRLKVSSNHKSYKPTEAIFNREEWEAFLAGSVVKNFKHRDRKTKHLMFVYYPTGHLKHRIALTPDQWKELIENAG